MILVAGASLPHAHTTPYIPHRLPLYPTLPYPYPTTRGWGGGLYYPPSYPHQRGASDTAHGFPPEIFQKFSSFPEGPSPFLLEGSVSQKFFQKKFGGFQMAIVFNSIHYLLI